MRRVMGKSVVAASVLAVALVMGQPSLRASFCDLFLEMMGFETSANSPGASGLAYNAATGALVVSKNTESASPGIDAVNPTTASHAGLASLAPLTSDIKLATIQFSDYCLGGFAPGDIYTTGAAGTVLRLSSAGLPLGSIVLPGETGTVTGLHQDRACAFDGDLIVITSTGNVWRVTAAGVPTLVKALGATLAALSGGADTALQGVVTLVSDVRYGPAAGRILAGFEHRLGASGYGPNGRLFAIDPSGHVFTIGSAGSTYPAVSQFHSSSAIRAEDLDIVPIPGPAGSGEGDLFVIARTTGKIVRASTMSLTGSPLLTQCGGCGGILVTQQFPAPGTSGFSLLQWESVGGSGTGEFHLNPVSNFDADFNPGISSAEWRDATFKGGTDCVTCKGVIGDFVWKDLDGDGIQDATEPPVAGVEVTLTSAAMPLWSRKVRTDAAGHYAFTGLCAGTYRVTVTDLLGDTLTTALQGGDRSVDSNVSGAEVLLPANASNLTIDFGLKGPGRIGDFVWHDLDANGVQDGSEPGIDGVTVRLTLGATEIATAVTAGGGAYEFLNLNPGTYTVTVDPPAGYTASPTGAGTPSTDSNLNPSTVVLTTANPVDHTVDFGFYQLTSLGDFVWNDVNHNGQQDDGPASGLAGSTVTLWQCGLNGQVGGGDDVSTGQSQVTPASGAYLFTNLTPGCYFVTFTTPAGYTPTLANTGNDATDSDAVAGVTGPYTLAAGVPNLTVDAGFYVATPGLAIVKTVNKSTIAPYELVTYTYTVTNTGGTTLTNIVVTDDNGTPATLSDDFTVGTIPSLAPGASVSFTASVIPVVTTTSVVNGVPVTAGAVIVVVNLAEGTPSCPAGNVGGCVKVTYLQDFGINDNTYGTGAIGWPGNNHTFNHLVGSDKLDFRFLDKNGANVLEFYVDTISSAASLTRPDTGQVITYPAGYGTLGPFGGDGSMVAGTSTNIVSFTTSITQNLNNPLNVPNKAALIVNSPTSLVAGNVVVDMTQAPGGWNHINNFEVVIKASTFGAAGFGGVVVPDQHNSPNKLGGPHGISTVAKNSTVVNTAKAVTASGGGLTATATASVDIVVPAVQCSLAITATKLDKTLQFTILNSGPSDVVLSDFQLTWKAALGKLIQINLDGDVVYTTPDIAAPSAHLDATALAAASTAAKRTIQAGTSDVLKVDFQNDVIKNGPLSDFTGSFTFAGCTLTIP